MSYAPLSPGAVVTATEWNEFASALDSEVVRATGAETTLDGRATALETFQTDVAARFPVGGNEIRYQFGAESLIIIGSAASMLSSIADPLVIAQVTGGPASGQSFAVALPGLPHGCRITGIQVAVEASGYTALPTTMPRYSLYEFNVLTGAAASVVSGPVSDPSATTGAFNAYHRFVSSPNVSIVAQRRYYLSFYMGTGGTGASAAIMLKGVDICVSK